MLIELSLNEIKKILKSYEFFCEKVNQSDALLARLMASEKDAASTKSNEQEETKQSYNILDIDFFSNAQAEPSQSKQNENKDEDITSI